MAERKWTDPQKDAIHSRGGSVLVSAAAGSGKTSVLVERVVRRITDEHDPVDIDRLLIVTFTKAAAAEMKQRLSNRLGEFIANDPENTRLQRQQMLLPTAPISTIDGFCTAFLREHFDLCGISPRFGIAEGSTASMLQNEALEETLEIFYATADSGFLRLCDLINGRKNDTAFKQTVLSTYNAIQAQATPLEWLKNACTLSTAQPLSDTVWGKYIRRYVSEHLDMLFHRAQRAADTLISLEGAQDAYAHISNDAMLLRNAALIIADPSNDWNACKAATVNAVPHDLKGFKGVDDAYKKPIQTTWGAIRKDIREKLIPLFGEDEKTAKSAIDNTAPMLTALYEVVEMFTQRYAQKKEERQLLDFSDLEHLTLRLLYDRDTDSPTPLAAETATQYREILVDEFQDTNAVQDTIFRMLSPKNDNTFFVGDVKQSIYGFRQAMPDIFIAKKESAFPYDKQHFPAYITLSENFRSRKDVTDAVNFVFDQLMTHAFCNIDYTDGEQLTPANKEYPAADMTTELLLMDNPYTRADMDPDVLEARMIAHRIREMKEDTCVFKKGKLQKLEYGDICILMRSRGSHAATIAAELNRQGIPTAVDVGTKFFEAPEILTALSLLRTVDNPLRDVSLAAVLLSAVGGFSADDLAVVRTYAKAATDKKKPALYASLLLAANAPNLPTGLTMRLQDFLHRLQQYRRLSLALPADVLLSRLLEETGLQAAMAVCKDGKQRVENLHELLAYAREFEQNGFKGLSAFVRYMDRLEVEKNDLFTSPLCAGDSNAVSIMTIHGSKGLEFPVVILARSLGQFNSEDSRKSLLLHGTTGAAVYDYDSTEMTKFDTVSRDGVKLAMRYTAYAEELRVLYVALTRAKEKLVISFVQKNLSSHLAKLASCLTDDNTVSTAALLSMHSAGDWLLSAFLRHPDATLLRHLSGDSAIESLPTACALSCRVYTAEGWEETTDSHEADATVFPNEQLLSALVKNLSFSYEGAALSAVPVKMAASALAHREKDGAFVATRRPAFLSADGMTPAERGTATHTFMQYANYQAAAADLQAEADRLYEDGFLTLEQRKALDENRLRQFFQSPLYARMCQSPAVMREYPFTIPLPASAFDPQLPSAFAAETMIVQGIADCVFEENGELVIVDYKTDRISDKQALIALYKKQLDIYREALSTILGKPVKETLLYAFHLSETVKV